MQEIALLLTGIAGAASAAAYKRRPKTKPQLHNMAASPRIQGKVHALSIERDVLTKTISRLYQHDSAISTIQRNELLSRYQHQLGIVLAKIEKLESAGRHPDLGPVGDGLVTLMDQKLSSLDKKLYEISAKIAATSMQTQETVETSKKIRTRETKQAPVLEQSKLDVSKAKAQTLVQASPVTEVLEAPVQTAQATADVHKEPRVPVELTTLTQISGEMKSFPEISTGKVESIKPEPKVAEPASIETKSIQPAVTQPPKADMQPKTDSSEGYDIDDEGSDEDLAKIKNDIIKTLSKLEQAEVE